MSKHEKFSNKFNSICTDFNLLVLIRPNKIISTPKLSVGHLRGFGKFLASLYMNLVVSTHFVKRVYYVEITRLGVISDLERNKKHNLYL